MNFRKQSRSPDPTFQIAPMIDVIFLLLCFFVASQMFSQWEMEIDVKLPTAETGQLPERLPGEIIINILEDGSKRVNNRALEDADLTALLTRIVKLFPGQPILIRADKATDYEHVISVLDQCRKQDLWNISFATISAEDGGGS